MVTFLKYYNRLNFPLLCYIFKKYYITEGRKIVKKISTFKPIFLKSNKPYRCKKYFGIVNFNLSPETFCQY